MGGRLVMLYAAPSCCVSFTMNTSVMPGLCIASRTKKVEETAAWLESEGITALAYHAGLDADVRPVLKNHDWQTTLQQQAIGPNRFFPESAPSRFCCHWPA